MGSKKYPFYLRIDESYKKTATEVTVTTENFQTLQERLENQVLKAEADKTPLQLFVNITSKDVDSGTVRDICSALLHKHSSMAYSIGTELYPITKHTGEIQATSPEHFILVSDVACHTHSKVREKRKPLTLRMLGLFKL